MDLNGLTNATTLDCAKATRQRLLRWLATVDVDVMHMDIQGDETALIPAILGILDEKVYRVVVRTHRADVHAQLGRAQRRWLVASDVPRQAQLECVWKYVRGNYKEESPHRFDWRALLREGCYVNTARAGGAVDGELSSTTRAGSARWRRRTRACSTRRPAAPTTTRLGTEDLRATPLAAAPLGFGPRQRERARRAAARDPAAPALCAPCGRWQRRSPTPPTSGLCSQSRRARRRTGRSIWCTARGATVACASGDHARVIALRRAARRRRRLRWSGYTPETVGTRLTMAAGGAKEWNGKGGAYVNGYALTFKVDVIRHAIEAGYSPTFIDADVAVTGAADLRAAIAATNLYDLYIAKGTARAARPQSTASSTAARTASSAARRGASSRAADRRLSFAPTRLRSGRQGRAGADGAAAREQVLPRESAVERRARPSAAPRRFTMPSCRARRAYSGQDWSTRTSGGTSRPRWRAGSSAGRRAAPSSRTTARRAAGGASSPTAARSPSRPTTFCATSRTTGSRCRRPRGSSSRSTRRRSRTSSARARRRRRGTSTRPSTCRALGFGTIRSTRGRARSGRRRRTAEGRPGARPAGCGQEGPVLLARLPRAARARYLLLELAAWPPTSPAGRAWAADRLAQALGRELVRGSAVRPRVVGPPARRRGQDDGRRHLRPPRRAGRSRCDVGFDAGGGRPRRGANTRAAPPSSTSPTTSAAASPSRLSPAPTRCIEDGSSRR